MQEETPSPTPGPDSHEAAGPATVLETPTTPTTPAAPQARVALSWPAASLAWPMAIFVAALGGLLGIFGAVFEELRAGGIIGAPIIEEVMKPAGVFIIMAAWPATLRSHRDTALLSAVGGLVFGLIESLIYVTLYYPDAGDGFVLFRFTVPVTMHGVCSLIMGSGLDRSVFDWAGGKAPFPKLTKRRYITAAGIHYAYNITVVVLAVTGILRFSSH